MAGTLACTPTCDLLKTFRAVCRRTRGASASQSMGGDVSALDKAGKDCPLAADRSKARTGTICSTQCSTVDTLGDISPAVPTPSSVSSSESGSQSTEDFAVLDGRYVVKEFLGHGQFGSVHRCTAVGDDDCQSYALKVLDMQADVPEKNEVMEVMVEREVLAMRRVAQHPGIVNLHEVFRSSTKQLLVMELISGGLDVGANLGSRLEPMQEKDACHIIQQVADALVYCHRQGVAHRDVKPHNVLIADADCQLEEDFDLHGNIVGFKMSEVFTVKLCDFGSAYLRGSRQSAIKTPVGTPGYSAPEQTDTSLDYDPFKADAFSLGMLAYVMLCLTPPPETFVEHMHHENPRWTKISSEVQDFLDASLVVEPHLRSSVSALCFRMALLRKTKWLFELEQSKAKDASLDEEVEASQVEKKKTHHVDFSDL